MYQLEIITKGMTENFQHNEVTKIHKTINETLQQVSITYEPKMLISLRQLQNKLKPVANNDFIIFKVEQSIIKIDKIIN